MNEAMFWDMVAEADWANEGSKGSNYEKIKVSWAKKYSLAEIKEARNFLGKCYNKVDKVIGDRNPSGGGDDSYGDICYHVVGLGKAEYERYLADYSLIEKLGKSHGYKECFAYCFPHESDYKEQDPQHFKDWGWKCVEILDKLVKLDNKGYLSLIAIDIEKLANRCLKIGEANSFEEMGVDDKVVGEVKGYVDRIMKFLRDNEMDLPKKFTSSGQNIFWSHEHFFNNLFHDIRKWS